VVEDLQSVFTIDGLVSSHPVYVPVGHPDEINEIFDRISYAKVRQHFCIKEGVKGCVSTFKSCYKWHNYIAL